MDNQYTGDVILTMGGEDYTLCYDWKAISDIETNSGPEALRALFSASPQALSVIIAAGLQKHHAGITPEDVMALSPPIVPAKKIVNQALEYAYFGPEGAEKYAADNAAKPAEGD